MSITILGRIPDGCYSSCFVGEEIELKEKGKLDRIFSRAEKIENACSAGIQPEAVASGCRISWGWAFELKTSRCIKPMQEVRPARSFPSSLWAQWPSLKDYRCILGRNWSKGFRLRESRKGESEGDTLYSKQWE